MSENQERKTWIMLNRGVKETKFTSNILPKFGGSDKVTTIKNKYGEWSISVDPYNHCNINETQHFSSMFDHDNTTCCKVSKPGWCSLGGYLYMNLPKGVSIKPTKALIRTDGSWVWKHYLQGLNANTNTWETISNTVSPGQTSGMANVVLQNFAITAAAKETYYTGFRVVLTYRNDSSSASFNIYDIEINEGTIKY